jgi:F0F1-type ATP synthase membrane subunit a
VLLFILAPVISTIPMFFMFILAKTIQAFVFFMLSMTTSRIAGTRALFGGNGP